MKKKAIILTSCIVMIVIIVLVIGVKLVNNSNNITKLLHEKYGENFKIVHDSGNEYKSDLLPTFEETGYKNVIALPIKNEEIKFNVRLKTNPLGIAEDGYIPANIAFNTSKIIEKNYKIGKNMYVHTSASEYKCDGKITNSFFDNIAGQGSIRISIYVEGLDNKFNCTEYINKILKDLNFDSSTTGTIRLYQIKENGIESIKNYYKNSTDMVKVENSASNIKKKYFETSNKENFVDF